MVSFPLIVTSNKQRFASIARFSLTHLCSFWSSMLRQGVERALAVVHADGNSNITVYIIDDAVTVTVAIGCDKNRTAHLGDITRVAV